MQYNSIQGRAINFFREISLCACRAHALRTKSIRLASVAIIAIIANLACSAIKTILAEMNHKKKKEINTDSASCKERMF